MLITNRRLLISLFILLSGGIIYGMNFANASYGGRTGYSGNPSTNGGLTCSTCHVAGAALPEITISGPTTVNAGETNNYSITITGGPAQVAGFNASVGNHDGLLIGGRDDTQIVNDELTHTSPKAFSGDAVVFDFSWTAPNANESFTMYAAGISANDSGTPLDDGLGTTSLDITVQSSGPTPSPTATSAALNTIRLNEVVTGLTSPTDITHAGDERIFVAEQYGRLRVIDESGTLLSTPFLNLSGQVNTNGSEMGVLGLTFHPNYASNGYFYVNYTVDNPRRTRISRFTVSDGDPNVADLGSELVILEFSQPDTNHNGGAIHFGPDGYLYIATGDGGGQGDPSSYGQNNSVLLSKLLRIDVDGSTGSTPECNSAAGTNYRIPANNPFADGAGGNCDEIWATGLRNPWRFSFDRSIGDLWIADVGQNSWEEIDFEAAGSAGGKNYGWSCYEANDPYNTTGCAPASDYDFPIHTYPIGGGGHCAITGGYVYRGSSFPAFNGHYFFTDFCTATFWTLSDEPSNPTLTTLSLEAGSSIFTPSTFGQDHNGELYVASKNGGQLYRIEDPNANANASISASVTFQGHPEPPNASLSDELNVSLTIPGDASPAYTFTPTTDNNGQFTVEGIAPDTYEVRIKHRHTLQTMQSVTLTAGNNSIDFGTLLQGDANNDNSIAILDFSILAAAFGSCEGGSNYDDRVDFNGDECIILTDFSLLSTNFGQSGE